MLWSPRQTTCGPAHSRGPTPAGPGSPCRLRPDSQSLLSPLPEVFSSYVNDDVLLRLRTADQHIARGGRIERIGVISHCAGNQSALVVVADSGPTPPADGDVAALREPGQ